MITASTTTPASGTSLTTSAPAAAAATTATANGISHGAPTNGRVAPRITGLR